MMRVKAVREMLLRVKVRVVAECAVSVLRVRVLPVRVWGLQAGRVAWVEVAIATESRVIEAAMEGVEMGVQGLFLMARVSEQACCAGAQRGLVSVQMGTRVREQSVVLVEWEDSWQLEVLLSSAGNEYMSLGMVRWSSALVGRGTTRVKLTVRVLSSFAVAVVWERVIVPRETACSEAAVQRVVTSRLPWETQVSCGLATKKESVLEVRVIADHALVRASTRWMVELAVTAEVRVALTCCTQMPSIAHPQLPILTPPRVTLHPLVTIASTALHTPLGTPTTTLLAVARSWWEMTSRVTTTLVATMVVETDPVTVSELYSMAGVTSPLPPSTSYLLLVYMSTSSLLELGSRFLAEARVVSVWLKKSRVMVVELQEVTVQLVAPLLAAVMVQVSPSILICQAGITSFITRVEVGKRGVQAIARDPTPLMARLDRVKVKAIPVAAWLGNRAVGEQEERATVCPWESVVQEEMTSVGEVVGMQSRFWTLLMLMVLTPMGTERGRVRGLPLYVAEEQSKSALVKLRRALVSEAKGWVRSRVTSNQVWAPTVRLPTCAVIPRNTGSTVPMSTTPWADKQPLLYMLRVTLPVTAVEEGLVMDMLVAWLVRLYTPLTSQLLLTSAEVQALLLSTVNSSDGMLTFTSLKVGQVLTTVRVRVAAWAKVLLDLLYARVSPRAFSIAQVTVNLRLSVLANWVWMAQLRGATDTGLVTLVTVSVQPTASSIIRVLSWVKVSVREVLLSTWQLNSPVLMVPLWVAKHPPCSSWEGKVNTTPDWKGTLSAVKVKMQVLFLVVVLSLKDIPSAPVLATVLYEFTAKEVVAISSPEVVRIRIVWLCPLRGLKLFLSPEMVRVLPQE